MQNFDPPKIPVQITKIKCIFIVIYVAKILSLSWRDDLENEQLEKQ